MYTAILWTVFTSNNFVLCTSVVICCHWLSQSRQLRSHCHINLLPLNMKTIIWPLASPHKRSTPCHGSIVLSMIYSMKMHITKIYNSLHWLCTMTMENMWNRKRTIFQLRVLDNKYSSLWNIPWIFLTYLTASPSLLLYVVRWEKWRFKSDAPLLNSTSDQRRFIIFIS